MHLSLLPSATPLNLSSTREFIKIEITCSGRPVQASKPTLPSHKSFSSSSSSTSSVGPARRGRPKLSPEALLVHAFGPSGLSRLSPPPSSAGPSTPSDDSRSSTAWKSASTCPSNPPPKAAKSGKSSKARYSHKCDSIQKPPPRGTFRSVPKPAKLPSPEVCLAELAPVVDALVDVIQKSCEKKSEREPPVSRESWSEKVEERLQRRKILRLKTWTEGDVKLPLNIDCRPLQGSLGLPPPVDPPQRLRKQSGLGLKKRNLPSPSLTVIAHDGTPNDKGSVQDKEERRKSMVELQDLGGLVKPTEVICLDESTD